MSLVMVSCTTLHLAHEIWKKLNALKRLFEVLTSLMVLVLISSFVAASCYYFYLRNFHRLSCLMHWKFWKKKVYHLLHYLCSSFSYSSFSSFYWDCCHLDHYLGLMVVVLLSPVHLLYLSSPLLVKIVLIFLVSVFCCHHYYHHHLLMHDASL